MSNVPAVNEVPAVPVDEKATAIKSQTEKLRTLTIGALEHTGPSDAEIKAEGEKIEAMKQAGHAIAQMQRKIDEMRKAPDFSESSRLKGEVGKLTSQIRAMYEALADDDERDLQQFFAFIGGIDLADDLDMDRITRQLCTKPVFPKVLGGKPEIARYREANAKEVAILRKTPRNENYKFGAFRWRGDFYVQNKDPTYNGIRSGQKMVAWHMRKQTKLLWDALCEAERKELSDLKALGDASDNLVGIIDRVPGLYRILFPAFVDKKNHKHREGVLIVELLDRNMDKPGRNAHFVLQPIGAAGSASWVREHLDQQAGVSDCIYTLTDENKERMRNAKVPDRAIDFVDRFSRLLNRVLFPIHREKKYGSQTTKPAASVPSEVAEVK